MQRLALLLCALAALPAALAAPKGFDVGDKVNLWAAKAGPFSNPSETYEFYKLPFCKPKDGVKFKTLGVGEIVDANRMATLPYDLSFRTDRPGREAVCTVSLDAAALAKFRRAVQEDWYAQLYYDDLPAWAFLGKVEKIVPRGVMVTSEEPTYRILLFTHLHFDVKFNEEEGHVIEWNVLPDPQSAVDVSEGVLPGGDGEEGESGKGKGRNKNGDENGKTLDISFTYSAKWQRTDARYADRLARYERLPLNPVHLEIHWFSIVNSCVTVLLLTGFMATILMRVLRADFARFSGGGGVGGGGGFGGVHHGLASQSHHAGASAGGGAGGRDEEAMGGGGGTGGGGGGEDEDESGWKYVAGDVFRFPPRRSLFAAFLGTGTQLLLLSLCIFGLALVGAFYPYNRGALFTALILLYALTAGVAGYVAASTYRQHGGGRGWARNVALTVVVYCGPFALAFCFLNTVAIAYRSTAALPFGTIVVMIVLWSLVTIPLTVLGAVAGRNSKREYDAPCRTNKYPREVPQLPWYRSLVPQMLLTGFLPFSAIYVELYYIFASVWGHKVFVVWPVLAVVYALVIVVTAFVTVAQTYFQLASEDHRWWWRAFLCGGSTAFFVYAYAAYYYAFRSSMGGLMQAAFFFGYNATAAYGLFLLLGAVGFRSSELFAKRIYAAVKLD